MRYDAAVKDMRRLDHRQIQTTLAQPRTGTRRYFGLAAVQASWLLVALCLGCGSDKVPTFPPQSDAQDLYAWVFGQPVRVTSTGQSEVALMLTKAKPGKTRSPTDARELIACGQIDDVLPSHAGTNTYFFVVNGDLYMGGPDKGAPRTKITIKSHIRVGRLLLLAKSTPTPMLLVDEAPQTGNQQNGNRPLWLLMIEGTSATARRVSAPRTDKYKRYFRNARCKQGDNECLYINNKFVDIEHRPGNLRDPYLEMEFTVMRALFHPDRPDTVLLLVACGK